jgi:unsaturated chondroitin disaccharide hydrolase
MAINHALRTMEQHVRPDGSSYHRVIYDTATGAVLNKGTVQGYSSESTWARGQAWGIYGFTMMYRETGDLRFLDTAQRMADWFIAHLPEDGVPYWDFSAPGIPDEPRDSSAAAIAASGLLELGQLGSDPMRNHGYLDAATRILTSLSTPAYLAEGTGNQGILLHGTSNRPAQRYDTALIYGDYYFLEALLRLRWLPAGLPTQALTGVAASAGSPTLATDGDPATAWIGSDDGAWLRLDLGQNRIVGEVTITWSEGDLRSSRFDIEVSTDGTTWTRATRGLSMGTSTRPENYLIGDRNVRYVRLVGHGTSTDAITRVAEIAVH